MRLEWDAAKDRVNREKHGISLAEAAGLFRTEAPLLRYPDAEHSADEDRSIAIGPIARGMISVVFVHRGRDRLRLISARAATRRESRMYDAWATGGFA